MRWFEGLQFLIEYREGCFAGFLARVYRKGERYSISGFGLIIYVSRSKEYYGRNYKYRFKCNKITDGRLHLNRKAIGES